MSRNRLLLYHWSSCAGHQSTSCPYTPGATCPERWHTTPLSTLCLPSLWVCVPLVANWHNPRLNTWHAWHRHSYYKTNHDAISAKSLDCSRPSPSNLSRKWTCSERRAWVSKATWTRSSLPTDSCTSLSLFPPATHTSLTVSPSSLNTTYAGQLMWTSVEPVLWPWPWLDDDVAVMSMSVTLTSWPGLARILHGQRRRPAAR